jgi:hypothetical protein
MQVPSLWDPFARLARLGLYITLDYGDLRIMIR